MRVDLDLELIPPTPLPKVQRQPRKGEKFKSRRPLIKGRIRSSAIAYVSPCRTKGKKDQWRVRYSRKGVNFERRWESRLLCAWVARQIHDLVCPELIGVHEVIDDSYVLANEKWPDLVSLLWIHGTDEPTIVGVDTSKFDALNTAWFKVKRHPWFVSPVVTIDENRKVQITWRNLGDQVHPLPMKILKMMTPAYRNRADQIVIRWDVDNLFRINPLR